MKNLDILEKEKTETLLKLSGAIKQGDENAIAESFTAFCENVQDRVLEQSRQLVHQQDTAILAARGNRALTSEEHSYYQKVIQAMQSTNARQELANLDVVMPKTIIDAVFENLTGDHELLNAVTFQNTSGIIEMIVNTHGNQSAAWGTLAGAIVHQLTSGFAKMDMKMDKLSAFLPISRPMLDLGAIWLDRYIRTILTDSIFHGLEAGIISGTGKEMPIGMTREVGDGVTVTGGVYPEKKPQKITSLDPVAYGKILSELSQAPNDKRRNVSNVIFVVNPVDYFEKIFPATTVLTAGGNYSSAVFPYPTTVIRSVHMPIGRAVMGIADRYFMGIGTERSGRIEFSDEYRFLEDERVYMVKLYGHGQPLDNHAFLYLNIENLEPLSLRVRLDSVADQPVAESKKA